MLIGKRINDRYKILEFVGGGGMANVYLAQDIILEREVAIKILRLDFVNEDDTIRRFHREAQSATSLVHPNIVNIFDVGEENDIYYIVMEYVEGETLKQFIQSQSPVPVEKVIDIMQQITSAISHAHHNNIIHRDIKPQNILMDKKGNVKITDFGIAVALTSTTITHTNSVLGSVHYISPEQARGGIATKKSDIYALGIVMFELLTGRLPFSGESAVSIALKHLQSETPHPRQWNPSIPQSVENIILKATAKDPHFRYETIEDLKEDLMTCLEPSRLNEPLFELPIDDEATKAIPVIKEEKTFTDIQDTIINNTKTESTEVKKNDKHKSDNHQAEKPKKKKKKKKWPIVLILLSILIVIGGVLAITVLPEVFGAKEIVVPDVTNLEIDDAVLKLEQAGFVVGNKLEKYHDEIPEDHVIRTDPSADRLKVEGSEITIYVSKGKEPTKLEDYRNQIYDEVVASFKSEQMEFKTITTNEVFNESARGTIIDQSPEPGSEILPEDTELVFTVSKGEKPFELVDLTSFTKNAWEYYAESNGITINVSAKEYHETIPEGYIIRQDIEEGTELKKGDTVHVVVSQGKEPKPITKKIELEIMYSGNAEEEEVQDVIIYIEDIDSNPDVPYRQIQITEDTIVDIELTIAPGQSGHYKVLIDGKVARDVPVPYE